MRKGTRRAASTTTARFAALRDAVNHYDGFPGANLNAGQRGDLVEYSKSL